MIQHEFTERATHRLVQRLRWAKLPIPACIEDIDTRGRLCALFSLTPPSRGARSLRCHATTLSALPPTRQSGFVGAR
jgi:hypothetical protein